MSFIPAENVREREDAEYTEISEAIPIRASAREITIHIPTATTNSSQKSPDEEPFYHILEAEHNQEPNPRPTMPLHGDSEDLYNHMREMNVRGGAGGGEGEGEGEGGGEGVGEGCKIYDRMQGKGNDCYSHFDRSRKPGGVVIDQVYSHII
ncbi:hypothetical protein ACOMHN_029023 [Nucella lapillus]